MGSQEDRLTEATYRPEWLREGVAESTLDFVWESREELQRIGRELARAKRLYLVGSGGSYAVQYPIRYLAERFSTVPLYQYSGWEFLERMPLGVAKDSACIFLSHSGGTREVVSALDWAREKGAVTLGISRSENAAVCADAEYRFGYSGRAVTLGKLSSLYLIFGGVFDAKGFKIGGKMVQAVERLTDLLPRMIPPSREKAKTAGRLFKDAEQISVVGGGINYGLAYQFAMCTLMEMCWVYSTPVDFSEFRHGPIEMFTPGSNTIFLKGRGDEDDLESAVMGFAKENGVRCFVCDSLGWEVENIWTPFTLFMELEWVGYYLSLEKNKSMEKWRYYDKVAF